MLPATEFGKDLLPELLRHKENEAEKKCYQGWEFGIFTKNK